MITASVVFCLAAASPLIVRLPGDSSNAALSSYTARMKVTPTMTCTGDAPALCEETPKSDNKDIVTTAFLWDFLTYRSPYPLRATPRIYLTRMVSDTTNTTTVNFPDTLVSQVRIEGWAPVDDVIDGSATFARILKAADAQTTHCQQDGSCSATLRGASGTAGETWFYTCDVVTKGADIYAPLSCQQVAIQTRDQVYLPARFATPRVRAESHVDECCGERIFSNTWPCAATLDTVKSTVRHLLETQLHLTTENRLGGLIGYIPVRPSTLLDPYFERGAISVDLGPSGGRTVTVTNTVTKQTVTYMDIGADAFLTLLVNRQRSGVWQQPSQEQEDAYIHWLRTNFNAAISAACGRK